MNIFWLDANLKRAAKYHCDKHVCKQILEYAQLLCSAHWMTGGKAPYKKTHVNHPCSIWTRHNLANYNKLVKLALFLCKEYTRRYGKIHKTEQVILWCKINKPRLPRGRSTIPPQCMPDDYKCSNVIKAYRRFYRFEKYKFAKWKYSEKPGWFR